MKINFSQLSELIEKIKNGNKKVALAVEGGGLRGIVSATLLECLTDLGLKSHIIAVSGTSSGAINSAYFLNNKMDHLFEIYRRMASSDFIQPSRWPNAMNLNFLFEEQVQKNFPLDLKKLKENPVDFYITATSIDTGISRAIKGQELHDEDDILKLLRASASAPLYTTNKEVIENQAFNDGHVQMAIPIQPLLQTNADFIFCLMTQKHGYRKKFTVSSWCHQKLALRKFSKRYRKSFSQSNILYNIQLEEIFENHRVVPLQIEAEDFLPSKMCRNPKDIDRCRQSVRRRFLGHS